MMNEQTVRKQNGDDRDAKAVEAGLAMHLRVKSELEDARREIGDLLQQITLNKIEIEGIQSRNNSLESRVVQAVAERDLAVTKHAKLEQTLSAAMAILRDAQVPHVPMIRKTEDKSHAH